MSMVVIAHNIRSTHNVGSILRTADGFGVTRVYATGYTPYPALPGDTRLPHLRQKMTASIHKTALGAETTMPCEHAEDPNQLITHLKAEGYFMIALEQHRQATPLPLFTPPRQNLALLLGEEVHGITPALLEQCQAIIEIPMHGHKESFNVSVATGIALYELSKTRQ